MTLIAMVEPAYQQRQLVVLIVNVCLDTLETTVLKVSKFVR